MLQLPTIIFLIASSMLAVINNVAVHLFLYWQIWWLDIPVHALGGAVVALGFFTLHDLRLFPKKLLRFSTVMGLVFLVALCWEAYELIVGVPIIGNYYVDTITDICMGLLGGVIGYAVGSRLKDLK